jgi:hypothetical protein
MRWSLGFAVTTAGLGLLPFASAGPGDPQIAFTAGGSFDQGNVVLLDARGEASVNLTPARSTIAALPGRRTVLGLPS